MNKIDRGTKLMEKIRSKTGMSEDGMNWLIAVLDPSHDEKLCANGYPDRNTGPSVLQVIKETYDIVQPAFTVTTGTWGFHIWLDDYLCNDLYVRSANDVVENQNIIADQVTTAVRQYPAGGLNAVGFNENIMGTSDVTTVPPIATGNQNRALLGLGTGSTSQTTLAATFLQGKTRKIAESFEVCNTTAELYRGGAVLCYEQPTSKDDATAYYVTVTDAALDPTVIEKYGAENIFIEQPQLIVEDKHDELFCPDKRLAPVKETKQPIVEPVYTPKRFYAIVKGEKVYLDKSVTNVTRHTVQTCTVDNTVPIALKEAMILPGTQQWGASEGCYCVQTMDSMENPPTFCNTQGSIFTTNELIWPVAGVNNDFVVNQFIPTYASDLTSGQSTSMNNYKTPFNKKGAIFSGLTPQSTFKVNRTIVLERFISSQDGSLATLSKMSPSEDYVALAFYSEIVKHLPIAARFNDNGLGDWFLGIADSIASTIGGFAKPLIGAAEGWTNARQGGAPVQAAPVVRMQKVKPAVKMIAGKAKRKGIVQGPRNPGGRFSSPQAKNVRNQKTKKQIKHADNAAYKAFEKDLFKGSAK